MQKYCNISIFLFFKYTFETIQNLQSAIFFMFLKEIFMLTKATFIWSKCSKIMKYCYNFK